MYCEILKTDEESIPAQPNIRIRVALGSSPGSTAVGAGVVVVVVACGVVLVLVVVNICVVVEFVLARLEVIRLLVTFGEGVLVRFETGEGVVLDSAELAVGDGVLLLWGAPKAQMCRSFEEAASPSVCPPSISMFLIVGSRWFG